jgi:hypothetical protein
VLSGVGTEYLVWQMYLHGDWNDAKELMWRAAQFIFPLLSLTALGLAVRGDFWALPFLGEYCFKSRQFISVLHKITHAQMNHFVFSTQLLQCGNLVSLVSWRKILAIVV